MAVIALFHALPPEVLTSQRVGGKGIVFLHRLTKPPGRLLVVLLCPVTIGMAFPDSVSQIAFPDENPIDTIHPFLWVAAAALKNQAFLISHTAELLC